MMKLIFLFSTLATTTDAFQAPKPSFGPRKGSDVKYIAEQTETGSLIKDSFTAKKKDMWSNAEYQRAADCAVGDAECDIDELYNLAEELSAYDDECSLDTLTVEDCMTEVSTRFTLRRNLEEQLKVQQTIDDQNDADSLAPSWYSEYTFYYQ